MKMMNLIYGSSKPSRLDCFVKLPNVGKAGAPSNCLRRKEKTSGTDHLRRKFLQTQINRHPSFSTHTSPCRALDDGFVPRKLGAGANVDQELHGSIYVNNRDSFMLHLHTSFCSILEL